MNSIPREEVIQFFKTTFENFVIKGDQIQVKCPFCGDSARDPRKNRFGYNLIKDAYHCFNGGCTASCKKGGFRQLVRKFGDQEINFKYLKHFSQNIQIVNSSGQTQVIKACELREKFFKEVHAFNRLSDDQWRQIFQFKQNREIPLEYPVYLGKKRQANRFVIPIYNNNEIIFWTGRSFLKKIEKRYLNLDVPSDHCIFLNEDRFDKKKPIVLVEGLIDAIIAQHSNITSCIGEPSIKKIKHLLKLTEIGIILSMDWDSTGKIFTKQTVKKCQENGIFHKIRIFGSSEIPNTKDFGDLVSEKFVKPKEIYSYILEHAEKSNLKSLVKSKGL